METERTKLRVGWYRSPVSRENLRVLNQRSDIRGFLQTGGYLGLLAVTGSAACLAAGRLPWPAVIGLFLVHGTCWAFLTNGFHELVHDSVFKTRALNAFFLRVISFLGWLNPHLFWASHTEHHKYTLHPPDDQEVVLPLKVSLHAFLLAALVSPTTLHYTLKVTIRLARGRLEGWEHSLFPQSEPLKKRRLVTWARVVLAGHTAIVAGSLVMGWWLLPLAITLAPFYGGWLAYLINNTQHVGLRDNVPDFRLCCRTVTLNPLFQFLCWHMNYHTEHHMYAAVPCYNLGKLHRLIQPDLPPCPHGLLAAWKQIIAILKRQKQDPAYQYSAELPTASGRPSPVGGLAV